MRLVRNGIRGQFLRAFPMKNRLLGLLASSESPPRMSDILFIKTSSLGDVIHHMPAVTDARRHRPRRASAGWWRRLLRRWCGCNRAVNTVMPVASRRWRAAPFSAADVARDRRIPARDARADRMRR